MKPDKRKVQLISLALALVTLAVYVQVLGNGFVVYDDGDYVTKNPRVQAGLTLDGLVWAFTRSHSYNWHPVTWISHMFDCQFFGLEPAAHHLISLLFHTANVLLLFAVLRRLTGAVWRSALVAALFAWHPLHVESVAWVSERKDLLCAFFGFLTIWAYWCYVRTPAIRPALEPEPAGKGIARMPGAPAARREWGDARTFYWLALVCFALGLMSKPMLVTLPFVLLLLDFWPLGRIEYCGTPDRALQGKNGPAPQTVPLGQLFREKAPFFLLASISSIVTFVVQKAGGAVAPIEAMTPFQRVANASVAYIRYLVKMVWPADLAIFYPLHLPIPLWQVAGALVLLAGVTLLVLGQRRGRPWLLFGWLWYLGMLVPVIGLVQVGPQAMADRYTYLPLIGIFIMGAWVLGEVAEKWPGSRLVFHASVGAVLVTCLGLTWTQTFFWLDTTTLFRHSLDVTGPAFLSECNVALGLIESRKYDEALVYLTNAAALDPKSCEVPYNMGRIFGYKGQNAEAARFYEAALARNPNYAQAHYNLGNILAGQDKLKEAAAHYTEALRVEPDSPDADFNLAVVLARMGTLGEAVDHFKAALRLKPNYPEAHDQLAGVLARLGHLDSARMHYLDAIRLKPDFAHPHLKLGLLLGQQNKLEEAKAHLYQVVQLEPTNALGYFNLAGVFAAEGEADQAIAAYETAARLDPRDPDVHERLGAMLDQKGKIPEAVAQYQEAVRLRPGSYEARHKLANLLAKQGNYDGAIQSCREALKIRPEFPEALGNLAWLLSTSPKAALRNGTEAVQLAEKACALGGRKDAKLLTILDAAYAEAGRFAEAIKTAEEAQAAAKAAKEDSLAAIAVRRIELYRAGKPFHQGATER